MFRIILSKVALKDSFKGFKMKNYMNVQNDNSQKI